MWGLDEFSRLDFGEKSWLTSSRCRWLLELHYDPLKMQRSPGRWGLSAYPSYDFLRHVTKQENTLMGGYNRLLKRLLMENRLEMKRDNFGRCKYETVDVILHPTWSGGPKRGNSKHQCYEFRNLVFPSSHKSVASGICGPKIPWSRSRSTNPFQYQTSVCRWPLIPIDDKNGRGQKTWMLFYDLRVLQLCNLRQENRNMYKFNSLKYFVFFSVFLQTVSVSEITL